MNLKKLMLNDNFWVAVICIIEIIMQSVFIYNGGFGYRHVVFWILFLLLTFWLFYKRIKYSNIYWALIEQGPFKRAWRNFIITGNAWGMFSINSHQRADNGKLKVMYNTKKTADKSAKSLSKKHDTHFSFYKCIYCNGYHLGKNRDNKIKHN